MLDSLTISQLAKRCQAEAQRYQKTGQSDETFCLELFRRALQEGDELAWQALVEQYRALVANWVHNHSRFSQTGEETDFFINDAFTRLWRFGSKAETAAKLDGLNKCLKYLKLCVGTAIGDYLRSAERNALTRAIPLEPKPGVERQVLHTLSLDELRQILWEIVQDVREQVVAQESWVYGFTPRQIQERYPEHFSDANEVSQIKKNIIKRVRRKVKSTK